MPDWRARAAEDITPHLLRIYGEGPAYAHAHAAMEEVLTHIGEPTQMTDAYRARIMRDLGIGEGSLLDRTAKIFSTSIENAIHIAELLNEPTDPPALPDAVRKGDIWVNATSYGIGTYVRNARGCRRTVLELLVNNDDGMMREIHHLTSWSEGTRNAEISLLRSEIGEHSRTHVLETLRATNKGAIGYRLTPKHR